jgi:hypothetical protein
MRRKQHEGRRAGNRVYISTRLLFTMALRSAVNLVAKRVALATAAQVRNYGLCQGGSGVLGSKD